MGRETWFVTVCIYYFDLTLIKFITRLVKYETDSKRLEPNPSPFPFWPAIWYNECLGWGKAWERGRRVEKKKPYLLGQLLDNILFKLERWFLCSYGPNIFTSKQQNQDNLLSVFTLIQTLYIWYSILAYLQYRREIYCLVYLPIYTYIVVYVLCAF